MKRFPLWVRQAVLDFIIGGVAALVALNIAIPHSLTELHAQALVLAVAILKALFGVAEGVIKAHSAEELAWLKSILGL